MPEKILSHSEISKSGEHKISFPERKRLAKFKPVCHHCGSMQNLTAIQIGDGQYLFLCHVALAVYHIQQAMPNPRMVKHG